MLAGNNASSRMYVCKKYASSQDEKYGSKIQLLSPANVQKYIRYVASHAKGGMLNAAELYWELFTTRVMLYEI